MGPTVAGYIFDTTGSYRIAYTIFGGIFFVMLLAMSFATVPVKPEAVESAETETPAES